MCPWAARTPKPGAATRETEDDAMATTNQTRTAPGRTPADPAAIDLLLSEIEVAARGARADATALVESIEWAARDAAELAKAARARMLDAGATAPPAIGFLVGKVSDAQYRAERHARSVAALDALVKAAQMLGRGAEAHAAAEKHLRGER